MKFLIQPNCGFPIYVQVATGICNEIGWRRLKMGDVLPPTRVLAAENGLDHKTIARAYTELRSQGVAYPSRPTGPYVIMSRAQHLAECERDQALKIMEALLRAIRTFRRMPAELEPHKDISNCLEKLSAWKGRLDELSAAIACERAKPAADLPEIISPTGIDEALARMAAQKADMATSGQEAPTLEAPWNNSQFIAAEPATHPAQDETTGDTPWNNSQNIDLGLRATALPPSDQRCTSLPILSAPAPSDHQETTPDTPWNNSINESFGSSAPIVSNSSFIVHHSSFPPAPQQTPQDTPWNNSQSSAGVHACDHGHHRTYLDTPWNNSHFSSAESTNVISLRENLESGRSGDSPDGLN